MGESQEQQSNKPQKYPKYDPENFKEFEAPDVTAWKLARSLIEHENILVNHRLTWLMTSQAFLFAAFSALFVVWGKDELKTAGPLIPYFMLATGGLAIYICLVVHNGVYRAYLSLDHVTKHYYRIVKDSFGIPQEENQEFPLTRTPPLHNWIFRYKYIDQFYLPLGMVFAWSILVLSIGIYIIPVTKELISMLGIREVLEILGVAIIIVLILMIRLRPREAK